MDDEDVNMDEPPIQNGHNRVIVDDTFFGQLEAYVERLVQMDHWMVSNVGLTIIISLLCSIYYGVAVMNPTYFRVFPTPLKVCYTKPCNVSAKFFLKALDHTVDPCHNFHQFVCGDRVDSKQLLINENIREELIRVMDSFDQSIKIHGTGYLDKLRKYYKTCVGKVLILKEDLLNKFNELGGWPMANKQRSWNDEELEWTTVLHKFYKAGLKIEFLIDIQFKNHPKNSTKKLMALMSPDRSKKFMKSLYYMDKEYMINIIGLLGLENVDEDLREMISFEGGLDQILKDTGNERYTTVKQLQSKFPKIQWLEFLNGFLTPHAKISAEDEVVYSMPYLQRFYSLMTEYKLPNRVLVNYFYWQNVVDFDQEILFDPSNMQFVKVKRLFDSINIKEMRKELCVPKMFDDMHVAISALYVRNVLNYDNVQLVKGMSEKIRHSLYRSIKKVKWLSEIVRVKVLRKISRIEVRIGYQREFMNETIIDDYYRDLQLSNNKYFYNYWNLTAFHRSKKIQEFTRPFDINDWSGEFHKTTQTRAVYTSQNKMFIFGGMLHKLLVDTNIPNYMNYGMLGTIVGHEFAHALGSKYVFVNKTNDFIYDGWDEASLIALKDKYACLVDQYNKYTYSRYNLHVDGRKTLEENMADITGLKAAYDAYVFLTDNEPQEPHLPKLRYYNARQMFWIAYGSNFCKKSDKINGVEYTEFHTPLHLRVNGAVSSLSDFAKDFNCTSSDLMNPVNKCPL